jgi:hypothetical protein
MYKNDRSLGGFRNRARGYEGVGSRSLEICRLNLRIELLRRFSEILSGRSVFRAAPMGRGFGGGARHRGCRASV